MFLFESLWFCNGAFFFLFVTLFCGDTVKNGVPSIRWSHLAVNLCNFPFEFVKTIIVTNQTEAFAQNNAWSLLSHLLFVIFTFNLESSIYRIFAKNCAISLSQEMKTNDDEKKNTKKKKTK